ncbi:uncharacterized protein EAE98_004022 [Botrytis deweyae]|uniref:Zn(2)-C6 fungal-type domain-containing protein n=1 Tax=Botrytis deweyae TaxID=2478750 RepID=A0ABQ7ISC7_9HELO|nr:uncharacterized protein EAE98_004022 [Botrytis deweyae]KAF7932723.1 hypothetical protein EAE98_004022 [Botrytis deweyae]
MVNMDNKSHPNQDDDNPNVTNNNNQENLNESIFSLPNMFNSANFAQASILSKDAESAMTSPVTGYTSIFSDVPSSTYNSPSSAHTSTLSNGSGSIMSSPVFAQTSIFGSVSNTHSKSPVPAQTSIFGDIPSSKSTRTTSAQASTFSNAPDSTVETSKTVQSIIPSSEVDLLPADPEPEQDPDIDPDASLDDNSDVEMDSNTSSRSISSSPEAPDFNAPAAPASETFSVPSYRSSPSMRCNMPRNFQELSIMFNSTKRTAAIKGQAHRIGTAGADRDDSGTYDPSLERKRNTRSTRAMTKKNKENRGETVKSVGTGSERKTKEQGSFELVVTIRLTSERGLEYLRTITLGPEDDERNFPPIQEADDEDSSDDDDDKDDKDEEIAIDYPTPSTRRKRIKTSHNRRSDGLTLSDLNNGHPQRRGCKGCFEAGDDECSLIEYSHEWPCESCEDAGIDCELIIPPELKLSCIRCKEKLRKRCSYADDGGKDVDSCKACEEAGAKCIAGPKAGSGPSMRMTDVLENIGAKKKGSSNSKKEIANKLLATAIATVTNVAKPKAAPRKYVSCNRCRLEFKAKCTLKRDEEGPCSRCIKAKVPCTFTMLPLPVPTPSNEEKGKSNRKETVPVLRTPQDITQTIILESTRLNDREWRTTNPHARRTKVQQKAYERAISSASPDEHFSMANSTNKHDSFSRLPSYDLKYSTQATKQLIPPTFALHHKGIRTIIIPTSFAHPLTFNYKRDPMALYPPCDFHSTPFFGLFGYGIRHVTVVPWPSITGAGYEELENGWGDSGAGHDATRMCVKCTYERVKILGCAEHELRPLEGLDERMRDDRLVRDSVKACEEGMMQGKWMKGSGETPERGSRADLVWRAKWCAVCPRPGDWICKFGDTCNGRRSLSHSTQGSQSHVKGCGLILCDTCYELHGKVQKGGKKGGRIVLGRVIQLAGSPSRRDDYPDGVRADAGLLRENGELFVRTLRGGCAGSKGEVKDGERSLTAGETEIAGRGINGGHNGMNSVGNRKRQGKGLDAARQRQTLDSVTVSRGVVVKKEFANVAKSKANNRVEAEDRDEEINEDIKEEDRMEGMSGGVLRTVATPAARAREAFTGDFTGDGVASGRWKGKGVDRRYRREIGANDVMRSSTGSEVIELSD